MTGIRFMDEITAPRRSTIHPGHLRQQNRRRSLSSSQSEAEPIPLAEYMAAMSIEVPQLELYNVLAEDLTGWIDESKKICKQAEEDVLKMTPALFTEFALADEVEKQDLLVSANSGLHLSTGQLKTMCIAPTEDNQGELRRRCQVAVVRLEKRMGRATDGVG